MKIFNKIVLISMILGFSLYCEKPRIGNDKNKSEDDQTTVSGISKVTEIVSNLSVTLSTDKALYSPGESVAFRAEGLSKDARIRYRHEGKIIREHEATADIWTWTAPEKDYQGYLVEVYKPETNKDVILGTIAVDVSSDWGRFPRYGFVADFDKDKLKEGVIEKEMAFLNRCHINGIQFYDWLYKHHWPLAGTRDQTEDVYKDIANRDVYAKSLRKYIDIQHNYGMKSMFYNLCYGALKEAYKDGVKDEWYAFKRTDGTNPDFHPLPSSWKSDIFLLNPNNTGWHDYIVERNEDVYSQYNFDGFHIDQLGNRGILYTKTGQLIDMPKGYASFINVAKEAHPMKRLVMNSVGGYGAKEIAGTNSVDFLYNEVWGDQSEFKHLLEIIRKNDEFSNHKMNTVFAAYLNYNCSDRDFNIPGVLMADAVMFALGGSHLELGDHMLCREYFPNKDVLMTQALKVQIIRYYDFVTAYETLLRSVDSSAEIPADITVDGTNTAKCSINEWPPQKGNVTAYSRKVENRKVIHLLNMTSVDLLSWRDTDGTMPAPRYLRNLNVKVKVSEPVKCIWTASPDNHAGAYQELAFEQRDGYVYFTVPGLKYWDMIVLE